MRILQGATSKKEQCLLGASAVRQSAVIVTHTGKNAYSTRACLQLSGVGIHSCSSTSYSL
jgi:hypothetical protein